MKKSRNSVYVIIIIVFYIKKIKNWNDIILAVTDLNGISYDAETLERS